MQHVTLPAAMQPIMHTPSAELQPSTAAGALNKRSKNISFYSSVFALPGSKRHAHRGSSSCIASNSDSITDGLTDAVG